MRTCLKCGKEIGENERGNKKYCSEGCRLKTNAYHLYHTKYKFSADYKKKRKERLDIWRKENRERFNELLREPNRIKAAKNYARWKAEGLCVRCGKERAQETACCCSRCASTERKRQNKVYREKKLKLKH